MPTKTIENLAYNAGRHDHGTQRPADCPTDLPRRLAKKIPAGKLDSLYFDHYVRGYNDAYHESLTRTRKSFTLRGMIYVETTTPPPDSLTWVDCQNYDGLDTWSWGDHQSDHGEGSPWLRIRTADDGKVTTWRRIR